MKYSLDLLMKGEPLEIRRGTEKSLVTSWQIRTPAGHTQPILAVWCDFRYKEYYFDPVSGESCESFGADITLAHPDKPETVYINLYPDGSSRWYYNKEIADAMYHNAFVQIEKYVIVPPNAKGRQS